MIVAQSRGLGQERLENFEALGLDLHVFEELSERDWEHKDLGATKGASLPPIWSVKAKKVL